MEDKKIYVKCSCGCSLLNIEYDFGIVWFNLYGSDFYNAQTHVKDLIENRIDILKHFLNKKEKYFTEIILTKENFEKFVKDVNELNEIVQKSAEESDDTSYLKSDIYIEYDKEIDEYILSIRGKYNFKDVLTGKVHRYYEPSLTKEDFDKFTKRLNEFVRTNTEKYTTLK